jgi:UDP-GlcNAc3NAcA epimerase
LKILTVLGARPQFIKAAVVSQSFNEFPTLKEVIVHTGQHYDFNMSDVFFQQLHIPTPKYHFTHGNLAPETMVARALEDISKTIGIEKPDFVLAYGDTNATAAAALAAAYNRTPLAHIEAGLRSYNAVMLEETNRILTDRLSDVLFCPTKNAVQNLEKEGFGLMPNKKILQTGDVMYDLSLIVQNQIKKFPAPPFRNYLLCTIHRAENTDAPTRLEAIIKTLNEIDKSQKVIMVGHPRTLQCLSKITTKPTFLILEPQGFTDMQFLLAFCEGVITDSGGLQKESFFHQKPCIILRTETEWTEIITLKCAALAEPNAQDILKKLASIKSNSSFPKGVFGKGDASFQIAQYFSSL